MARRKRKVLYRQSDWYGTKFQSPGFGAEDMRGTGVLPSGDPGPPDICQVCGVELDSDEMVRHPRWCDQCYLEDHRWQVIHNRYGGL